VHMIWHERTHRSQPHRWLRERLREVSRSAVNETVEAS
jgi:DNA-binding transcriptional LysR family regulator